MSKKYTVRPKNRERILTFDLLRGFFMFSIILNHLQWYPNGYDIFTAQGALHVSAAEGFFILSGIVLGIVRGKKMLSKPFRAAAQLILRRGILLYITSIILTMLFMVIGWLFFMDNPGLKPGIRPVEESLFSIIMGVMSFEYIYGWADFLRLYAVFLIATPFALWLIRRGLWYVVLAASIGVWSLFPWAYEASPRTGELLMMLSWQLIFFSGFIIGFYWDTLSRWWYARSQRTRRRIITPLLVVAAGTLLLNVALVSPLSHLLPQAITSWNASLTPYFIKEAMPLMRIVLFALWFILGFYLFKRFEKPLMRTVGWFLLPLGQNSLYAYILHAIILFFVHLIIPPDLSPHPLMSFLGATAILGIIYVAIKKRFLFRIIPR